MKNLLIFISMLIFTSIGTLFAQSYSGGAGTSENPYQISTLENLRYLSENGESDWDKHFIMTNDINASDTRNWNSGQGWSPIGDMDTPFSGEFDGNDNVIDGLYIYRSLKHHVGCFGATDSVLIFDISITNCNISGGIYVGGLIGQSDSASIVRNSNSTGIIHGQYGYTGGLIGFFEGSIIIDCNSLCNVFTPISSGGLIGYATSCIVKNSHSGGEISGNKDIGGLIGGTNNSEVIESYSTGMVSGVEKVGGLIGHNTATTISKSFSNCDVKGKYRAVGGLIGFNYNASATNCYATGSVSANDYTGGLIGYHSFSTIVNCYSVGRVDELTISDACTGYRGKYVSISNCFYDNQTSMQNTFVDCGGKTTAEMKTKSTFTDASWDFESIWAIAANKNNGYPYLKDSPVGITEAEIANNKLKIYPNPATNIININYQKIIEKIEIYDISGQLLMTTDTSQIDVSNLTNGVYQVVLRSKNQIETKQFIILR